MDCPECGYHMDAFETACPRCKRLGTKSVSVTPSSSSHTQTATLTRSAETNPEDRERRDRAATRLRSLADGAIFAGWIIGCLGIAGDILLLATNPEISHETIIAGIIGCVIILGDTSACRCGNPCLPWSNGRSSIAGRITVGSASDI